MELTPAKREVVEQLTVLGWDPTVIATALELPVSIVNAVHNIKFAQVRLLPEDRELADKVRILLSLALDEAKAILNYGSPTDKAALVRTLAARAAHLVGIETTTHMDEVREEFDKLMSQLRGTEEILAQPPIDV